MATNLAGRAGAWSARHWRRAVFGWLAFALVSITLGSVAGHVQMKQSEAASGEAARALRMIEQAGMTTPAGENVLFQSRRYTAWDIPMIRAISGVLQALAAQPNAVHVRSPWDGFPAGQISRDGHSVLVQFDVRGDPNKAKDKIAPILNAVAGVQDANPTISIREVGAASANYEMDKAFNKAFANAKWLMIGITLLILLVTFGTAVAAGLPVLLAFSAVLASLGVFSLLTHGYSIDWGSSSEVILLIGMAVGIDYSLFYLRREREERAAGQEPRPALLRAAATSGQAVLISGVTVLIALAGMLIAGNKIFSGMAIGTMIVVLCAIVGSITVLPAALARLGDAVDRGRVPFIGKRKRAAGESRFWGFVLDRTLRRPVLALCLAGGLLLAAATPVLSMHTKMPSFTDMPRDLPIVQTYRDVITAFPGAPTPASVVVSARDVPAPVLRRTIRRFERAALATGKMFQPISVISSRDRSVLDIRVPIAGNGDNAASLAALSALRHDVLPTTLGTVAGVDYAVTGDTAVTHDWNQQMKSRMPWVIAFVLGLAFVLLLMTFRSIVIPLTAIALNLLSVGAAYGLLVLIFQHSWAEGIFDFTSNYSITSWLPLFLFVVLFGLSMDYHVFILSRIKELRDRGLSTEESVSRGIRGTAGTVTSAAIIMVAVFSIFATMQLIMMKQLGIGLALAVLIDATIIRGVLLPAAMKLLGDWNWYLPHWLDRLPTLTPEAREPRPPHGLAHGH